ncbi:HEAT repeats [uncultured archaeon]|nr:HEAT repeats [uncultured archaeon]
MEEEKKAEGEQTKEKNAEDVKSEAKKPPVITRSMMEQSESCETCGAAAEPEIPKVLPDASWSTERLIEASKDKNMLTRSNAVMLLGKRSPSEALEPLIEALKDKEYVVKTNAMVAIAAFGRQVLDRMIAAIGDANGDVRAGAAWVLGELKDQKAIEHLEKVAKDDYPLARVQAKASLMAMGRGPKKEAKKIEQKEETVEGKEE